MPSYRFCRSDDIPLLVRAHNECYAPHFPGLAPLTEATFKLAAREIQLWASSCMVATRGERTLAVVLATKRPTESLIWRIGVRPDALRQGHGRHLLDSLAKKLAILGPPRMLAEVPADWSGPRGFFEACGYVPGVTYTDFEWHAPDEGTRREELEVVPVTAPDLVAQGLLDPAAPRCWERSTPTLVNRATPVRGWGVAAGQRIAAYLLYEEESPVRSILGLGSAENGHAALGPLVRHYLLQDARPVRISRVHQAELDFDLLPSWAFEPTGQTVGYAASARS